MEMQPGQPSSAPKSNAAIYIVGIIIIALVVMGVTIAGRNKMVPTGETSDTQKTSDETPSTPAHSKTIEVEYTDANGFTPDHITIAKGDTVSFVNKSTKGMWVGSNEHPTHTNYDGTSLMAHCATSAMPSFDQCGDGKMYSFTFNSIGTWNYHNHLRPKMGGTIVVK